MTNIVFIITDYGSFNNFLGELAIELINRGNRVSVICSKDKVIAIQDKYNYEELGIDFYNVSFPRNFNLIKHYSVSLKIHSLLKNIKPDIVSIHFTTAIFTTLLSGKPLVKTIGMFHGVGYPMIDSFFKKMIFKNVEFFSMKRLDEIWVLNQFDANLLEPKFINKVFLLPTKGLGCNLEMFNFENFSHEEKIKLREDLGILKNDFVILFTGRYVDFKGYDIVIRTILDLEKKFNNLSIKLITLGGRDKIHPTGLSFEEEDMLQKSSQIIDRGFTNDVAKYMSIADLFFFPSKKEGVPVCIIEALSMNVPVVTFDARGCNDLVQDNYNGKLLDLNSSIEDFTNLISKLVINRSHLERFKENISKDRELYSRDNFIMNQVEYFNSL